MSFRSLRRRIGQSNRSVRRGLFANHARSSRGAFLGVFEALEDRMLLSGYGKAADLLASDISTIQTNIDSSFSVASAIPILGTQLQLLDPIKGFADQFINTVTTELRQADSPDNLGLLLGAALGNAGLLGPKGVSVPPDGSGGFDVKIDLATGENLTAFNSNFSLGLGSFLSLQLDSKVQLKLGFDYLLEFDVDASQNVSFMPASLKNEVDTSLPDTPLAFNFNVTLPNLKAVGRLNGLMQAVVTNVSDVNPAQFGGNIGVGIADGSGNFPTTIGLSATADLPLHLALSFADNAPINPKLTGDLHLKWQFDASSTDSSNQDSFGDIEKLEINNINLDLGDLLPDLVTNVIGDIQKITKPLQPIVDFFKAEIPGLNDIGVHLSLRYLMGLTGESGLADALDAIDFINNNLPSAPTGHATLPLGGTLSFSGSSLKDILAGTPTFATASEPNDPNALLAQANSMTGQFFTAVQSQATESSGPGFSFPIVTDPLACAWELLAGQNADIFKFKAPSFDVHAEAAIGADFGLFSVDLSGFIDVNIALSMGYDTNGLKEFIEHPGDVAQLLNGFYVDNAVDPDGQHHTGVNVNGNIKVGASLAGVTLTGSLDAVGSVYVNPKLDSANDKVYLNDILNPPTGPLFVASGDVSVGLNLSYGFFGIELFSCNLAQATLFDFNTAINGSGSNTGDGDVNDPTIYIDEHNGNQTINVYESIQVRPDVNEAGLKVDHKEYAIIVDYGDKQTKYLQGDVTVDHDSGDVIDPITNIHNYTLISTPDLPTEPTGDHTIIVDCSVIGSIYEVPSGNNFVIGTSPINAVLVGGSGNDDLEYQATGQAFLVGGGGSNRLIGGQTEYGNYIWSDEGLFQPFSFSPPFAIPDATALELDSMGRFEGGIDPFTSLPIPGVGGNNLIGTPGDDLLVGGPVGNFFDGVNGDDKLFGGIGANYYDVNSNGPGFGEHPVIDSGLTNRMQLNENELIIRTVRQDLTHGTFDVSATIGTGNPLPFDSEILNDQIDKPLTFSDPSNDTSVIASGIEALTVVGDGTYDVGALYSTTVGQLAIDLGAPSGRNGLNGTVPDSDTVTLNGQPTKDIFTVASTSDQGTEMTTVQDTSPGQGFLLTTISNLGGQDIVNLNGGGGGDLFVVNLDETAQFSTAIHDAGSNLLTVDASEFTFGFTNAGTGQLPFRIFEDDRINLTGFGIFASAAELLNFPNGIVLKSARTDVLFDSSITTLNVIGSDGGDDIQVNSLDIPQTNILAGDSANTFEVQGSTGNLSLRGGRLDDTFDVPGEFQGSLDIEGDDGRDLVDITNLQNDSGTAFISNSEGLVALHVDDSADRSARIAQMGTILFGEPGFGYITGLSPTADIHYKYADTNLLTIDTGAAEGNVFGALEVGVPTSIVTHALATVNVGDGNVGMAAIAKPLTLSSTIADAITLNLNDEQDIQGETVTITSGGVSGLAPADIDYSPLTLSALNINGDAHLNTFDVQGTPAPGFVQNVGVVSTITTINCLSGDTVNVGDGSGVQDIQGSLIVNGALTDSVYLNLNDQADRTGRMVTVANGSVRGMAPADIDYGLNALATLSANGGTGGNSFDIQSTPVPEFVPLLGIFFTTTTITCAGADTVNVGDASGVQDIQGPLTVNSKFADFVTLNLNDQADRTGRTVTMASGGVSGLAPVEIEYGVNALANLNLNGGAGANTFEIQSTPAPEFVRFVGVVFTNTTVTCSGTDTVNVSDSQGRLDGIQGPLAVAGNGSTTLILNDQGTTTDQVYQVFATELDRTLRPDAQGNYVPDMGSITYADVNNLALHAGAGDNICFVESTAESTKSTDVYGGTGTDEFLLGILDGIQGPAALHGQSGPGEVSYAAFNDANVVSGGEIYTLTDGALNRSGVAPITYDGLVEDVLYTSEFTGVSVNVQSNAANVSTVVVAGAGDLVTIGSLAPALGGTVANIQGALIVESGYLDQIPAIVIDDSGDKKDHPAIAMSPYPNYDYAITGLAPAPLIFGLDPATPVRILGGSGNDAFTVASPLPATGIQIDGGGGSNTLTFDDQATTTDETYNVTDTTVGRTGSGPITYANMANLALNFGGGSNLLDVYSTAAGTSTIINGGAGDNDFFLEGYYDTLNNIKGPVTLHRGGHLNDAVFFGDAADAVGQTYTLTANTMTRSGIAPVTWDTMNQVDLYTGSGQDQINVQAVAAGTFESLVMGTGDTMTVGSLAPGLGGTLDGILGPLDAESYSGQVASVIIDDSGDATSHPLASLQNGTYGYDLTGLAPTPIYLQLDPAASVKVRGGTGDDTFTIATPLPATGIQIDGGGGGNTLTGPTTANTWAITGKNSGTLNTVAFSNFQSLVGGPTSDLFRFSPAPASIGTITGGTGAATLDYSLYTRVVNVNLGDGTIGTATGVSGTVSGISALIGGSASDTLNAGTVSNVSLTGGLGTNSLSGTGTGDTVVESIASSYTLTNTRLTGNGADFADKLSGVQVASLTGDSVVNNAFTVNGWTGTGSLRSPAGTGSVTARKSAGFTLADTTVSSTDGMSLGLRGITTANLTDNSGGSTFTITGWTGGGTLRGNTETLVDVVSNGVALARTSFAVTGLPALTLAGFTTANLTDTAGGNTFTVSAWTGSGSLMDLAAGADTVAATKGAGYTLSDTSLASTDGMLLGLSGIKTANLAATSGGKTFTVSDWTGSGSLTGTATGTVTAIKNAGFVLSDASLSSTDGMTLALSGVARANLTTSGFTGGPSSVVDATAFTGITNLVAAGASNATLLGGSANGSTLSATGSGNDVLIGGPGRDALNDTGTGYNILIGGPGVDTLTGNGNDIMISGTTNFDSHTIADIGALDAILAEWSSSEPYSVRISKIMNGVGGGPALNSSTCQSDGVANTVSDGASSIQNNWFIVNKKDKVAKKSNETVIIV